MIDIEAKERPSMANVLAHPFFWSNAQRFRFLCAVGNEHDVKTNSQEARGALPPSLLPKPVCWSDALDFSLWKYYTRDQARKYNTGLTTHLLRFLRNCEAHPPDPGSMAQSVLVENGGAASYFCQRCFPQLSLGVWRMLGTREEWSTRSGLRKFLAFSHSRSRKKSAALPPQPSSQPPPLPEASSPGGEALGDLEQWLVSIHSSFAVYAAALKDYGYEDLDFVQDADEEDFDEALTQVGMTKPAHRSRALKRFRLLQAEAAPQ
jgi:hypothetical protein